MLHGHVTFKSRQFPIEPGEDRDTNPGIFGRSLAGWLAAQLRQGGYTVEEPIAEDFGRLLMIHRKPFMLWVACASVDDSPDEWQVQVVAESGLLGRLKGVDARGPWSRLCDAVEGSIRRIPDVSDIIWDRE